ncbi:APC family permease [Aeromicrobium sp.]|uniref:APC family permease n=1 Tax=Aeromicrobium sp. TaxID=1871063 RepID=UPI0030C28E65
MTAPLDRRLGLLGSVAVGTGAMIGAGLFVAFPPAAAAAGDGLLLALGIAAAVAACNAISSARLARRHPVAGGTYAFGRERLGPLWGYLAGWSFVAGKTSSCAAMAFALGTYIWPDHARLLALGAVVVVTAVNLAGVEKSAAVSIAVVAAVVGVVLVAVVAMLGGPAAPDAGGSGVTSGGVLQASGLLFFAFAGYARLATLGEEVREPARTIPVAMAVTFVLVLALYTAAAAALLHSLGTVTLAESLRPFVAGVDAAGARVLVPSVLAAAALAAGGALLSLMLGVSRTTLAMARDGHLPRALAGVSPRTRVPHVAEVAVALVVAGLICVGDLITSVTFSSYCVLAYYAITNLAAWTLSRSPSWRVVCALGLAGCLTLALGLPTSTVIAGTVVIGLGAANYLCKRSSWPADGGWGHPPLTVPPPREVS